MLSSQCGCYSSIAAQIAQLSHKIAALTADDELELRQLFPLGKITRMAFSESQAATFA